MRTCAATAIAILGLIGGVFAWAFRVQQQGLEEKVSTACGQFHLTASEWERAQSTIDANRKDAGDLKIQVARIEKCLEAQSEAFTHWENVQKDQWGRVEAALKNRQ